MKKLSIFYLCLILTCFSSFAQQEFTQKTDWLVNKFAQPVEITSRSNILEINNGLLRRRFVLSPNLACYDFQNLSNNQQLIRAIKPEARITIDGKEYQIGGLHGQQEMAYFKPEWIPELSSDIKDFQFVSYSISELKPYVDWKARSWYPDAEPAKGKELVLLFKSSNELLKGLDVEIHYEAFEGIPLLVKWLKIINHSNKSFELGTVVNEILGFVEEESAVVGAVEDMKKQHGLYVETNYAFNNAMRYDLSDQTTHWKVDSSYTSQVNYNYQTPCLLEIYPEKAPGIRLLPGETFQSVRTHELLMDSYDRQRRGLMIRKMYRTVAPWTAQNPIFMHLISKSDEQVKTAIDQCVATGYEAVILSFGSHLNMEDQSATNLNRWKKLADYAHEKGILLGGYSLFSSRRISDEDDVIDPKTGKPGGAFFGNAPCFGSKWGLAYKEKIKHFFEYTGFDIWENDGPYPGDVCASTSHPGHQNLHDSQWRQMEIQKSLYRWLSERGIYINAPDWYFLDGTHKIAIGYREVNFSLSREQQQILNRQNIHDGTQEKTPAMSWGFVPLTKYQGGGPEAILEPLSEHLDDYRQLMMQYYGAGVQACYRGPRLYDTEETRQAVVEVVNWYKKYREILNSDLIQLRRADGRDWDGFIHVNPELPQKGLLMLFNPTNKIIEKEIDVPLYYSGISESAIFRKEGHTKETVNVERNYSAKLQVSLAPNSYVWYEVEGI